MPEIVVFTLVAPIGAFGDLAGHELRGSESWPGRSAILGLIGAALGIRRNDAVGQTRLNGWKTAVSVLSVGDIWRDFHTVQAVPAGRIKRPDSRGVALAALTRSDNAIVSRREYRSDCAFGVAVWGGDAHKLVEALKTPTFTPYLGRKSCPLSAPMAPIVLSSTDPISALSHARVPDFMAVDASASILIASDIELGTGWKENRWDDPLDREAWHFGPRIVYFNKPDPVA